MGKFKSAVSFIFRKLKGLVIFAIFLGGFLLLDQAGGMKLIIFVILSFLLTMYLENREVIDEIIVESLIRR